MQEFYDITVAGVKRSLPVVPINENMSIAGFVIFGDTDVVEPCARALAEKLPPETEVLVTAEAKSIPLIYEMAKVMKMPRYVIARKSVKGYMRNPIITTVNSITNMGKEQILVVDEHDAEFIKGKKVAIIDDVISAGTSVRESVKIIEANNASPSGVLIAVDRMERGGTADAPTATSAVQDVEKTFGLSVVSIINLHDLLAFMDGPSEKAKTVAQYRDAVAAYRARYGA